MDALLGEALYLEGDVPKTSNVGIRFDRVDNSYETDYETKYEQDINEIAKGESLPSLGEEDSYNIQFNSLISWFLRSSSSFKLKCMHRMLQTLKDKSHLDIILLSLNFRLDKTRIYSQSLQNTNYIYDIKLTDHNRALERNFLEETLNIGIAWFETLSSHEQIETIIELLKRAGAALVDKFYDLALKYKKDLNLNKSREEDIQEVLRDNSQFYSRTSRANSQQEISKNPFLVEIEKRSKMFNEAIIKYTNQIMGITEKSPRGAKKTGKSSGKTEGEKASKSPRKQSGKSGKKSMKSDQSKLSYANSKTKEKKAINQELVIDQIQQLPIWIVKKIFSYFDQKTLKKLRAVNIYWAYVIDDMAKERSCRKYMDKVIIKMKKNMKYKVSDLSSKSKRKAPKLSIAQKRMKKLRGRGAIHPKLRTTNNNKTTYPILMERTIRDPASHLIMPTKGYESFPRNVPNNQILLATPTCILNELGRQPYRGQENAYTKKNLEKIGVSELELTEDGQKSGRKK